MRGGRAPSPASGETRGAGSVRSGARGEDDDDDGDGGAAAVTWREVSGGDGWKCARQEASGKACCSVSEKARRLRSANLQLEYKKVDFIMSRYAVVVGFQKASVHKHRASL